MGQQGKRAEKRSRLIGKKEGKEERVHISFTQAQERRDRKVERPQRGVGEGVKKSCTYSICLSVGLLVGDDGFLDGSIGNESIALYIGIFWDCVCCVSACFCVFLRVSVVFLKADRVNDDVARGGWVEVYAYVYRDRSQRREGDLRTLRNTAML